MVAVLTPEVLADPVVLTRALVDIESVSGNEKEIAHAVQSALATCGHLTVERLGNTVIARTSLGRSQRGFVMPLWGCQSARSDAGSVRLRNRMFRRRAWAR